MRRRVNKSAIALLIGLGFIAALSIHLLHGYQLTRGVQRLVKQAQMALATGNTLKRNRILSSCLAWEYIPKKPASGTSRLFVNYP
jgi:hypothetical protein